MSTDSFLFCNEILDRGKGNITHMKNKQKELAFATKRQSQHSVPRTMGYRPLFHKFCVAIRKVYHFPPILWREVDELIVVSIVILKLATTCHVDHVCAGIVQEICNITVQPARGINIALSMVSCVHWECDTSSRIRVTIEREAPMIVETPHQRRSILFFVWSSQLLYSLI